MKKLALLMSIVLLAGCPMPQTPAPNPLPGVAWTVSPAMNGLTSITFTDETNWNSGATVGTYTYDKTLVHINYPGTDVYYALTIIDPTHHVTLYHGPTTYDLTR
jgi:uncharacterized lipoprotein YajG